MYRVALWVLLSLFAIAAYAECALPQAPAGALTFNTTHKVMQYCNGTNWINTGAVIATAAQTGCNQPQGVPGQVMYNQSRGVIQFCNGSSWIDTACAATRQPNGPGCTEPDGAAGHIIYETNRNELQFCDSTNWVAMGYPCPNYCALPWGGILKNQQSVTAYQTSFVFPGNSCDSETRTCQGSILSGSYTYQSCAVRPPYNCTVNGTAVNHGDSRTFYTSSSVTCGNTCSAQVRTCQDGVMTGDAQYQYTSCSVGACSNCTVNGTAVTHNTGRTFYTTTSVGCGGSCSSQYRTCTNGTMSGSSSYQYTSCSVGSCSNCSLDGVTVSHGSSRTFYSTECGSGCPAQSRTCSNGSLSGSSSYNNASCSSTCAGCGTYPAPVGSISHGQSKTFYSSSSVGCSGTCQSLTRTCNNGSLSGSYSAVSCTKMGTWAYQSDVCQNGVYADQGVASGSCPTCGATVQRWRWKCNATQTARVTFKCQ